MRIRHERTRDENAGTTGTDANGTDGGSPEAICTDGRCETQRPGAGAPERRVSDQKLGPRLTCQRGDQEYGPFVRQATSTFISANQT